MHTIESRRVVLCAGATSTPGILLRSGIGPRAKVERLGVDVVVDLPSVGARACLTTSGSAIFLRPHPPHRVPGRHFIQTLLRYTSKSGPRNDMFLQAGSVVPHPYGELPLVSIMESVGKSYGRGTIEFTSPNPRSQPRIESRLFLDEADRARGVDAMQLAVELARTPPMKALASFFWPPERVVLDKTRLAAWLGRVCDSSYHPCGTVPMGPDSAPDTEAATDGRGRVRHVEGLWVGDASLMPTIPSSHTNLTVLMMGERFGEVGAARRALSQSRRRVRKLSTATKSAEPTIDQMTGKASRPMCQTMSSGSCRARAIHCPSSAPMKPRAMDPTQPP